jgi:hypothetical protein
MALHKVAGIPLAEGLESAQDLPHTLTQAIMYRAKLDSLQELPEDKQPPRNLWDKPYALKEYLNTVWDSKEGEGGKGKNYAEFDLEDVE